MYNVNDGVSEDSYSYGSFRFHNLLIMMFLICPDNDSIVEDRFSGISEFAKSHIKIKPRIRLMLHFGY